MGVSAPIFEPSLSIMAPPADIPMAPVEYARDPHEREHALPPPPADEPYDRSPPSADRQYIDDYRSHRVGSRISSLRRGQARSRTSLRQRPSSPVSSEGSAATSPTMQRAASPPLPHSRSGSRGAQSFVRTRSPGRERDIGPRSKLASLVHDFASPPAGPAPVARA